MKPLTPIWIVITTFLAAISLSACDSGGDSSSNAAQDDPNDDDDADSLVAYSGKVADGYIVGATVCLDINRNGRCDIDEPSTTSSGGGNYTLDLDPSLVDQHPVVVEVGTSAYDEDTGEGFSGPFRMTAPAGQGGFVSPLTTLVASQMATDGSATPQEAEAALLMVMGFGPESDVSLFEDYIERGSEPNYQVQHRIAQGLALLLIEAENKLAELATDAEGGFTPEQSQQAVTEFVSGSIGDLALAALEGDTLEAVVANWTDRIQQEVDSDLVISRVTRSDLLETASTISLPEFAKAEQENSFYFSGDYLQPWTSVYIEPGELVFTIQKYEESAGDFVDLSVERTVLLLSEMGELIRSEQFSDHVHMVDEYESQDGSQSVAYIETEGGALHRLDELLEEAQAVPIGGLNVWQTLRAVHPEGMIQPIHKGLFDSDAVFGSEAQAVMIKRTPIGDPVWTMNYYSNCSAERLAEIGEVDESDLMDNCSRTWLHGLDWPNMPSNSLADVMNSTPFSPVSDPNQNYKNLREGGTHVMFDMGEHQGITYMERSGPLTGTVRAELVGSLEDATGTVNWYVSGNPLARFIESNDHCQGWADLWSQVNGNCSLPDYLELPLDADRSLVVPADFSDVLVNVPTLDEGEKIASQLLNNLGKYQAILVVMELREGELYEGIDGTEEYSVHLAGELLGENGDEDGILALYEVTKADTVTYSYWACNSADERNEIEALGGNCAIASNFDYSEPFTLADQVLAVKPDLVSWTPSSSFENTPYFDVGNLDRPVATDEACGMNSDWQPFRGVMIGTPGQESGTFLVFEQGYFESNSCNESVRELASLTWLKMTDEAGNLYYEIDINSLIDAGMVSSFHGDWDSLNPGYIYLSPEGDVLRHAQLRVRDSIAERLPQSGSWSKETIDGRETIEFEIPDSLKTEDWHRVDFSLVVDNGIVRPWWLDEVGQMEPLNASSEWVRHDLGDVTVLEITRPDVLGLHLDAHGITDVGTRIRHVRNHLRQLEGENRSFRSRTWYTSDVLDLIKAQVLKNYSSWASE